MKAIPLILMGVAIWLVWRVVKQALLTSSTQSKPKADAQSASNNEAARMLKCEQCGVHVPEQDSFSARGHQFCSNAHQQAWLAQHDTD